MPDAAYGFGYPFFSYYAALPYYLAAGLTIVSVDILTAIKLTQTVFFAAAALAMYEWSKGALRSRPGAWLAAVAYTVAPFHLVNVYVRGDSLSEFAAFAFYPLILLGLERLAADPSWGRMVLPSTSYAGLVLTHNVSALIFSPFILFYVVILVVRSGVPSAPPRSGGLPSSRMRTAVGRAAVMVLSLLLGLLLSAWFWLPALAEAEYVQLEAQTTGYFFYGNHFRSGDLVQPSLVFDFAAVADRPSPFAMGALQAAVALIGVLVVIASRIRRQGAGRVAPGTPVGSGARETAEGLDLLHAGFVVLGLLLATWLITPTSQAIWRNVPLLPLVQFPWRFLSVQAVFGALLAGALVAGAQRWWGLRVAYLSAIVIGVLLSCATLTGLEPEYIPIRSDEVNIERLQLFELFTGNVGSTIRHEYLPRWVEPRPYVGLHHVEPQASARATALRGTLLSSERVALGPTCRRWRVETGGGGADVALPLHYWPGWRAAVDGRRAAVGPVPGSGYLSVKVPAGIHEVEIWLGRTRLRLAAELMSFGTIMGAVALGIVRWRRNASRGRPELGAGRGGAGLALGRGLPAALISCFSFGAALAVLIAVHPRVTTASTGDLTMDFEGMPYLHHNPDGIVIDGGRLTRYEYGASVVSPGDALRVTLEWERIGQVEAGTGATGATVLRLVSPAAVRHDIVPPLGEARIDIEWDPGGRLGRSTVDLAVPPDAPPGVHLLEMAASARTYLRPVWVRTRDAPSDGVAVATFADGRVRLNAVAAAQPSADRLDVQLDWSAEEPLAVNYGLNLSLVDVAGNEWLRQGERAGYDTQPGLGYLPTSLWPVRRAIDDHHIPSLLPGIPPGDRYTLTVDLYNATTWESVGEYSTGLAIAEAARQPAAALLADLGEGVGLSQIDVPRSVGQGERLEVTAYFLTNRRLAEDFTIAWRLEMPERDVLAYAGTQPMAPGSLPTDWPAGAWVAGRVALPIPPLAAPGEHRLSLELRSPSDGAVHGTFVYREPVQIRELERVYQLPDFDTRVGARFGGVIELAGYSLKQDRDSLNLTLHWRALANPEQHYMYFVHLADPDNGRPIVQVDTMPRLFTYPTGMWATGEIVSEEVSLSVRAAARGRYELAVGWYEPDTMDRLRVVNDKGERVEGDRLVLPDSVLLE
jgi:hypothetical protein